METKTRNKMNWQMLASFLSDNINETDRMKVQEWIEESQENRQIFQNAEKIWRISGNVTLSDINVGNAWDKVNKKAQINQGRQINMVFLRYGRQMLRIAAVLVIGLITAVLIKNISNRQTIIAGSDILELALNDGSHVDLNKNSQLQYPKTFSGNTREVFLKGEAYFEVAHNPEKPFIIHTPDAQVRVLGTSFDLKSNSNGEVEIIVNSGTVKLTSNKTKSSVILKKDEKATFSNVNNKISKELNNDINFLSWKTKKFVFRETRLEEVFQKLEHVYDVRIVAKDPSILDLKLNATYDKVEVDEIVNFIRRTFGLHVEKEGNLVVFRSN
jgi:ferric-dicitrate binding protein FerR (iron transport regulator)